MALLCKKVEKENIKNYLPILLLSVIYKNFPKALTIRLESVLDLTQLRQQAGFQSGYSTMAYSSTEEYHRECTNA